MKARSGFTLVEILIVVIILGILAAIVIPQFSDASTQARESSLRSDLQTMRSQIELYDIQHLDNLPGAGTATFVQAMTGQTDVAGAVGTGFGPYVLAIPTNPINSLATVRVEAVATTAGAGTHGWTFNSVSGIFESDSSGYTFADGW
jgi:general secretion pathway protein G